MPLHLIGNLLYFARLIKTIFWVVFERNTLRRLKTIVSRYGTFYENAGDAEDAEGAENIVEYFTHLANFYEQTTIVKWEGEKR